MLKRQDKCYNYHCAAARGLLRVSVYSNSLHVCKLKPLHEAHIVRDIYNYHIRNLDTKAKVIMDSSQDVYADNKESLTVHREIQVST